jgi:hypothetical protein
MGNPLGIIPVSSEAEQIPHGTACGEGEWRTATVSLNCHAGLVPASTAPRSQRPLARYHGGCRDGPGMTNGEAECRSTSSGATLERGTPRTATSRLTIGDFPAPAERVGQRHKQVAKGTGPHPIPSPEGEGLYEGNYFPSSSAALRSLLNCFDSLNCCCEQPSEPPGPIAEQEPIPDAPVSSVPCARNAQL